MIGLKRIYDPPSPEDGERVLVERLWARGLKKEDARLSAWIKELAPSTQLRKWYGHDPQLWPEFRKRYEAELRDSSKRLLLEELAARAKQGVVTLVYAAKDEQRNSAVVLKSVLEKKLKTKEARKKQL